MAEGPDIPEQSSAAAIALETIGATALALLVSLRFGVPVVWLIVPLGLIAARRRSLSEYGLDLRFRPPSWTTHLVLGVSLLLLYAALHVWFAHTVLGQSFAPRRSPSISSVARDLVTEFLVVGVPEEVFFRGYLQTRWNERFGRPWTVAGARVGPALLIQSAMFAICHLATGDWTRLRVFFFALLAGWLRERSGSVAAPAAYHAVANVWYRLIASNFR